MRKIWNLPAVILSLALATGPALAADPMIEALDEAFLRELVPFGPDDQLKLAECDDSRFLTCTHIWGPLDEDDAARLQMGGMPSGSRLTIIAAESTRESDFDRVLASYTDAVPLPELGPQAVWSAARSQLSMRTDDARIIHVNTDRIEGVDIEALAIAVMLHILAQP